MGPLEGSGRRERRMVEAQIKPRFWRGPIVSQTHAKVIINWAAWPIIASSPTLFIAMLGTTRHWKFALIVTNAIPMPLIAVPSLILLWRKGTISDLFQFSISLLFTIFGLGATFAVARIGHFGEVIGALAVDLLWIVLTIQTSRAVAATRALLRFRSADTFS